MNDPPAPQVCMTCWASLPHPPPGRCPNCGGDPRNVSTDVPRNIALPGIDSAQAMTLRVLGGCALPLPVGAAVTVTFGPNEVAFDTATGQRFGTMVNEGLLDVRISGPGRVTSGGGFIGGGFGLMGAVEGVALASVLNAATSRSQIVTLVSLVGDQWELHGVHTEAEPEALRIRLAPVFTRLRQRSG